MVSALAKAYQVFKKPEYLDSALKAMDFIKSALFVDGNLIRSFREGRSNIRGFADDYAFAVTALLDLYETRFDVSHLLWAVQLQEQMDNLFWDASKGGYFGVEKDSPFLVMRMKEDYDGAEPSPVRPRNRLPFHNPHGVCFTELVCGDEFASLGEYAS